MRLIAHRGLMFGPNKSLENNPVQIQYALRYGFDCEIDVWFVNQTLYLGHDGPQYKINPEFLKNDRFWVHAKNFAALDWLSTQDDINYFWHDKDTYTLTSKRFIWTCETTNINTNTVVVLLDKPETLPECYGICSDYGILIREKLELK